MEFGVTMIFLVVAYYSYQYIIQPLSKWLNYQARLPEYNRDKNKPLSVGQVWTDGTGRYFTIDAVNGDSVKYTLVLSFTYWGNSPNSASLPRYFENNKSIEYFDEIRNNQRLHLTNKVDYY